MLPPSIRKLVTDLFNETREGRLVWVFNSESDAVECSYKNMHIYLDYKFDYNLEQGLYMISIDQNGKNYYFTQTMYDTDYDWLKTLHYEAQGSEFKY